MSGQEPSRKRKLHVTNFQDDEASDSYEGDDAAATNDYDEESMEEEDTGSDMNIVNSDDEDNLSDAGQIHEHRRLDMIRNDADNEQSAFGRPRRHEGDYMEAEEDRRVCVEETDPHIYRVPVKRGKQLICILKMNFRLTELKIRANNPEKFRGLGRATTFDIRSIFCNPNDTSYIYIESTDLHTCEMFLSSFMEYLRPYTATTFAKRAVVRSKQNQPPPPLYLVPASDRQQLLHYELNLNKVHIGAFYKLKQGKRAYRGDSCCVIEVRNQLATVAVLPRVLSLSDRGRPSAENPARRITREEFEDYMGDTAIYVDTTAIEREGETILLQNGYEILRNIPVRGLGMLSQEKNFQAQHEIVMAQISEDDKKIVNIVNRTRRDNEKKLPLELNEQVLLIENPLRNNQPDDLRGIIRSNPDGNGANALYKVEVISFNRPSKSPEDDMITGSQIQKAFRIARNKLIRIISIGDHIQVQRGKYRGTTGEVREVARSSDRSYLLLRIKVDLSNEYIGSLGIDLASNSEAFSAFYDIAEEITSDEVRIHSGTWNGSHEVKLPSGEAIRNKYLVQTINDEDAVVTFIGHTNANIVTASGEECTCEIEHLKAVQRPFNMPMPKDHVGRMVSIESIVRIRENVDRYSGLTGRVIQTSINNPAILFVEPTIDSVQRNIFPVDSRSCDSLVSGRNVDEYNRKLSRNRNAMNIGQQVICMDKQYSGKQGTLLSINDKREGQVQLSEKKINVPLHLLKVAAPLLAKQSMQVEQLPTQSTVSNVFGNFNFSASTVSKGSGFWYGEKSQTTKDLLSTQYVGRAQELNLAESVIPTSAVATATASATRDQPVVAGGETQSTVINYGTNDDSEDGFEQAWDNF